MAGSSVLAQLIISTDPLKLIPLSNIRDNGTANTEFLFLNPQFFVPTGLKYKIELYDKNGNNWDENELYENVVEIFTWTEFKFGIS